MPDLVTARATTRAMSCPSSIVVVAESGTRAAALAVDGARRLHELEHRWTRFSPDSELSGLNRANGTELSVSWETRRLVEKMVGGWHATGGAFDPTLLVPLVGMGYASSRDDATRRTSLAAQWNARGCVEDIVVDEAHGTVRLPADTVVDPGGIGKGVAADLIVEELLANGAAGALAEIGGDVALGGTAPEGPGWPVAITDRGSTAAERIELASGGVATSSTRLRTWKVDGRHRHHLLDPATLGSTESDVAECTVIAGDAATAEAFTKVAFVDGLAGALHRYDFVGLAACVTTADGHRHRSNAWKEFRR